MTIITFQNQCKPGMKVEKEPRKREGVVLKISKERDKALVQYENCSKEWNPYYLLEIKPLHEQYR